LNKTKDEEKLGGPYRWARELKKILSEKIILEEFSTNWKQIFTKKIFRGFQKIKNCGIVHVYVSNLGILLLTLYAKLIRKKILYTCHGDFFREAKSRGIKLFIKYYLLALLADYFVFPSHFLRKRITTRIKKRSYVIYNGIDAKRIKKKAKKIRRKKGEYLFLAITNFDYKEKCDAIVYLIRAFEKLNQKYPNTRLYIAGGGEHLERIKSRTRCKNIIFLGPTQNIYDYLNSCDCYLHISGLDNLPLAILEAMVFSKPIIASKVGGIPEISKKIILVNNNVQEILEKMERIYHQKKKKVEYTKELEKFSSENMAEKFIKLYNEILHDKYTKF